MSGRYAIMLLVVALALAAAGTFLVLERTPSEGTDVGGGTTAPLTAAAPAVPATAAADEERAAPPVAPRREPLTETAPAADEARSLLVVEAESKRPVPDAVVWILPTEVLEASRLSGRCLESLVESPLPEWPEPFHADAEGRVRLRPVSAEDDVLLGAAPGLYGIAADAETRTVLALHERSPWFTVTGRLFRADGPPLRNQRFEAKAWIREHPLPQPDGSRPSLWFGGGGIPYHLVTDAEGRFRFDWARRWRRGPKAPATDPAAFERWIEFTWRHEGGEQTKRVDVAPHPAARSVVDLGDVRLEGLPLFLDLLVLDQDGLPVAEAEVVVDGSEPLPDGRLTHATARLGETDVEGRLVVWREFEPDRTWALDVQAEGHPPWRGGFVPGGRVVVDLAPGFSFRGRLVLGPEHDDVAYGTAELRDADGGLVGRTPLDRDRSFSFDGVPAGSLRLRFEFAGGDGRLFQLGRTWTVHGGLDGIEAPFVADATAE